MRALKRIFGPKRYEIIGGWRKLHSEEFHDLYSSSNLITMITSWRMRWAGYVARMGEKRIAYSISAGTPGGKSPLGRPGYRWEENIKWILEK
jgi:hypothetical protein